MNTEGVKANPEKILGAEQSVDRRDFIGAALGIAGIVYVAGLAYPVYRYLRDPVDKAAAEAAVTEVKLTGAQQLPVGSAMYFKFGARPALLIRFSENEWAAFSAVCTHLGCTVQYQPDQKRIYCACHGGVYDPMTGKNIAGPPPRPLTRFLVSVQEDGVVITREQQG